MRKSVELDGKQVQLASHGATAIFYRQEFGEDFFADVIKLAKGMNIDELGGKMDLTKLSDESLDTLDLTIFYRLTYIFAKSADKNIPPYIDWLSSFEEFPLMDIIGEVVELMESLLQRKKK